MSIVIVQFPGSAAEEAAYAFRRACGTKDVRIVWHDKESVGKCSLLVVPGGAAYCDYLRPGALAKSSAIGATIRRFSREGRVIGIGNGFQILCELGVLPGALLPNAENEFLSVEVHVRLETNTCKLTEKLDAGSRFRIPLGCFSGRYHADQRTLTELEEKGAVVFRYCDEEGDANSAVTGSVRAVAGISNFAGNVLGMMPHPEYVAEEIFGNTDGVKLLQAFFSQI